MTNTQNTSLAATVVDALQKTGEFHSARLSAQLRVLGTFNYAEGQEAPKDYFDVVLYFSAGYIGGIALASNLDEALRRSQLAYSTYIDWDMDLLVFTHGESNFSITNWTEDPSNQPDAIRVKFHNLTRKDWICVLTYFLHDIETLLPSRELEHPFQAAKVPMLGKPVEVDEAAKQAELA